MHVKHFFLLKYYTECLRWHYIYEDRLYSSYFINEISINDLNDYLLAININDKNKNYVLDICIPFCEHHCDYCMYFKYILPWSKRNKNMIVEDYVSKISKNIELISKAYSKIEISYLDINWWTPSIMSDESLELMLSSIHKNYFFSKDAFKLFESTPALLTKTNVKILDKYWINCVVLWMQSIYNNILESVNRFNSSTTELLTAYKLLRESNIKYVQSHVIIGLPNDSVKNILDSIEFLCKIWVDTIEIFTLVEIRVYLKKFFSDNTEIFNKYVYDLVDQVYPLAQKIFVKYWYIQKDSEKKYTWTWHVFKKDSDYYKEQHGKFENKSSHVIWFWPSKRIVWDEDFSYKWDTNDKIWGQCNEDFFDKKIISFRVNSKRFKYARYISENFRTKHEILIHELSNFSWVDLYNYFSEELSFLKKLWYIDINSSRISIIQNDKTKRAIVYMFLFWSEIVSQVYDKDKKILNSIYCIFFKK